jgi:hypothetical protein
MTSHQLEIAVWNRFLHSSAKRFKTGGRTAIIVYVMVSCCFGAAGPVNGQVNPCDPGLKQPSGNSPNAYRQRSDRCEGIYAREVAGDVLLLGSLTESFDDFTPTSDGRLRLSWRSPGNEAVHLRVYSLRPHFYYRMDSAPPPGRSAYIWPTDVLAALDVHKSNLGVVASSSTSLSACGVKSQVYLPLRIGPISATGSTSHPQAVLLSDVELSEVYVTVVILGPDGQRTRVIKRNKPLGYGDYPAEVGVIVPLPELTSKGVYLVEVAATLRPGGSSNLSFCVYQGGN